MSDPPDRDDELSELRIRRIALERRAAIRAGSYFLIAAFVCLGCAAQFVYLGIRDGRPILFILAFFMLLSATSIGRRARSMRQKARQSVLSEPTTPPDFSTLSDGSQQWKKLEDVR